MIKRTLLRKDRRPANPPPPAGEPPPLIAQADGARDAGRWVIAAALYELALEKEPDNGPIHVQCGHMYKEAGLLSQAEPHYLRAKELLPGDADLALQLGHFYKVSGRKDEAAKSYRRAAELEPGWQEPQDELAGLEDRRESPDDGRSDEDGESGRPHVIGTIDGMVGTEIRGWAYRADQDGGKRGNLTIAVSTDTVKHGYVKANQLRPDVARAHGCDEACGFSFQLPFSLQDGRPFSLHFEVMPERQALSHSPYQDRIEPRTSADRLAVLRGSIEALCTQAYELKDQMRAAFSSDTYTLSTYNDWASEYLLALHLRIKAQRGIPVGGPEDGRPLVSVVCPTYRPHLPDFMAAIDSVRAQTYPRWELVIVDDGSRSEALTEAIRAYAQLDSRIRHVELAMNGGISEATNAGIEAANGDYVAFFDHDDLLVDVALEAMMQAAERSKAKVLYSDEDKVDQHGLLSEPNFKTDWNPRLLLSYNYVCHLLVVETKLLRTVGRLRSEFNGAQDYDLIFRLAEAIEPGHICHVAEVLYHWRKSATSTAAAQSSKPYVLDAGRAAVTHHLARRGLPGTVRAVQGKTTYAIDWKFTAEPSVAILIPFKDQVGLTRRCVEALLQMTSYQNYDIVLIDNWSTDKETLKFLEEAEKNVRVRVIRIEESFNFSRINNIATGFVDAEFYLFLNNDVFVTQHDWLRRLVDEMLADPKVGAVGAKLLYPNGLVQHAGVVLGVGGVADHAFRNIDANDPGYAMRAVCAQQYSAVTAACMLCRSAAFEMVGGFDEGKFSVAFNDVDLCLKIVQAGWRIVYTPDVTCEHHESVSRGSDFTPTTRARFYGENQAMVDRWGALLDNDPFYNPHFSRENGPFYKLTNRSLVARPAPATRHDPVPDHEAWAHEALVAQGGLRR